MSRSQSLLYAVLLTGAALSLFRILYVGSRLKKSRWWAGERLLTDIWVPIMLILFAFGIDFAIAFALSNSAFVLDRISSVWMAGICLVVLALWILLGRAIPVADEAPMSIPLSRLKLPPADDPPENASNTSGGAPDLLLVKVGQTP